MDFQIVKTSENNKSQTIFDNGTIYVYLAFIDYTYREQKIVFFVSGKNGDEFGQFATAGEAIDKANSIKK